MRRQSQMCLLLLGLGMSVLMTACSSGSPESSSVTERHFRTTDPIREPFTRYFEVTTGAGVIGYLMTYDALPNYAEIVRTLPAGSHRIQGLDFADLGYVTTTGEFCRYDGRGGSTGMGRYNLETGLAKFFSTTATVALVPLRPAVAEEPRAD